MKRSNPSLNPTRFISDQDNGAIIMPPIGDYYITLSSA